MKNFLFAFLLTLTQMTMAQEQLPYAEIPQAPEAYSPGAVVSRMIDGFGFRYYWATEGLRPEDLAYKPSDSARTSEETLDHILGLSEIVYNASVAKVNSGVKTEGMSFEEKRARTLNNLKKASENFRKAEDLVAVQMTFPGKEGNRDFAVWYLLNGPLADGIWHVGQVVSFRRASGNPFNSKVSVFMGKLRD